MKRVTRVLDDVHARLFRAAIVASLASAVVAFGTSVSQPAMPDLIVVQVPIAAQPSLRDPNAGNSQLDRYVDGSRIVLVPGSGGAPVILTPDFAAASDPSVSFDAKTILFAGKKSDDASWHIWRMDIDGSNKAQITQGDADNITPVYAGSRFYLNDPQPTPQVIFASTAHGWANERGGGPALALYGTDLAGETLHRLTFNLNSDMAPDVLPTGRIVFTSWQEFGGSDEADGVFALMGVNIDGTDLMPFYGNHETPRYKGMVHVSAFDDRVYFVESDHSVWLGGGDIAYVSRRRPLNSHRTLTDRSDGFYHSPFVLPDGGLCASYRARSPNSVYGLYRVDPTSGERGARILEEPGWHSVDAQVLASRSVPKGRSNWLIPGTSTGVFYALDSYRTNLSDSGVVERGAIKHVRVIEGLPRLTRQSLSGYLRNRSENAGLTAPPDSAVRPRRLLGIAPVAADGSFHIRVPAETPVTFQLLDANYLALRTQRSWTWVIGNESRGCIGCHENRELSPPNKMTEAVVKPPVELTLPPERRRKVDFRHQIAPIITSRCTSSGCHASGQAGPELAGASDGLESAARVYRTLLGAIPGTSDDKYVIPGNAKESPLTWLLLDENTGSSEIRYDREHAQMPPHNVLSTRQRILFTEWIDLGAQWDLRTTANGNNHGN